MNDYFSFTNLTRFTLARASDVNSRFQGVVNAFDMLPSAARIREDRINYVVAGGAPNDLTASLPIPLQAYTEGLGLRIRIVSTTTEDATLNVDGLGVKPIKRADGTATIGGDLVAGQIVDMVYNGAEFRLVAATEVLAAAAAARAEAAAAEAEIDKLAADGFAASAHVDAVAAAASAADAAASAVGKVNKAGDTMTGLLKLGANGEKLRLTGGANSPMISYYAADEVTRLGYTAATPGGLVVLSDAGSVTLNSSGATRLTASAAGVAVVGATTTTGSFFGDGASIGASGVFSSGVVRSQLGLRVDTDFNGFLQLGRHSVGVGYSVIEVPAPSGGLDFNFGGVRMLRMGNTGDLIVNRHFSVAGVTTLSGVTNITNALNVDLAIKQGGNQVWHAGNFDPSLKANLNGATFTGLVSISYNLDEKLRLSGSAQPFISFYSADGITRNGYVQVNAGQTTLTNDAGTVVLHAAASPRLTASAAGVSVVGVLTATGAITQAGNQVWHAGNFTPANYASLAGANTFQSTVTQQRGGAGQGFVVRSATGSVSIVTMGQSGADGYISVGDTAGQDNCFFSGAMTNRSFIRTSLAVGSTLDAGYTLNVTGTANATGALSSAASVTAPQHIIDANTRLFKPAGTLVDLQFDTTDILRYDQTVNEYQFYIAGTAYATLTAGQFNVLTALKQSGNQVWHAGNLDPALKANLASPALTGVPTAPTAGAGTNTTQLATTAFVAALGALKANLASPALTGTATVNGVEVGFRGVPQRALAIAGSLQASDRGGHVYYTGAAAGITIPPDIFVAGDAISIVNNGSGLVTITQGAGVTIKIAGTGAAGNRTLSTGGMATILCVANNLFFVSGAGLA